MGNGGFTEGTIFDLVWSHRLSWPVYVNEPCPKPAPLCSMFCP